MSDTAGEKLHQLFEDDWKWTMENFPEMASRFGEGGDGQWTDRSLDAIERRKKRPHQSLQRLSGIDRSGLSEADRLNHDLYRRQLELQVAGQRFPEEYLPLNQMGGVQQDVPGALAMMPVDRVEQVENVLARLRGIPALVEQNLALLRGGVERGLTPPKITLRDVPQQVADIMKVDGALYQPFTRMDEDIPENERRRLAGEGRKILETEVIPAYRKLHDFLLETYIPAARDDIALGSLPGGAAWYAHRVKSSTTTDLGPEQIHEIGLSEVKRIRTEMDRVIESTGFEGSFAAFLEFLRTDPRFYYETPEELLAAYRDIAKRADPELTRLFGKLPRLPYGVKAIPSYQERSQTTAYYQPGSPQAGRPGYYYANTYALHTRPKWEMEALSLHEAVPGHHLQIALAQEMEGVPRFRQHSRVTAFVEGWGLYSESLGEDMGFYKDPYSRFGQLTYEMWRAIRLVVDTGMHALGWSRRQAIEFFKENAGKTENDIVVEIDRYIVWPGQALAYKLGELKIKELRARAEKALGESFDLRAFHDELLSRGAIPLSVLEERMEAWVAARR